MSKIMRFCDSGCYIILHGMIIILHDTYFSEVDAVQKWWMSHENRQVLKSKAARKVEAEKHKKKVNGSFFFFFTKMVGEEGELS